MKRTKLLSLAIASLICAVALHSALHAAQRPRYGGTLRVEMRERVNSMDPRGFDPAAAGSQATERLLGLVYDRLVRIDERGQPQPALAFSWQHDANFTHWQFQIHPDVRFHDDTKLTADIAVASLQAQDWPATALGGAVTFAFTSPRPNLAVELASGRSFIFHAAQDTVFGTGAFRIAEWQAGQKLVLTASEEYWAGRPFVDRAEITLGISPQQQINDLELGHADVIEVLPTLARRAGQTSARVWNSSPVDLFAITFTPGRPASQDPRLAQALSLAIDRVAIVNVILQRQGEPAASLLPQWLSGYAFLFPAAVNLEQAKQLRAQVPAIRSLSLVYDGGDPVAVTVAERFAVNARDLGITVSLSAVNAGAASPNADLRLVRWHIDAPDSQQALGVLLARVSQPLVAAQAGGQPGAQSPVLDTPEKRYAAERAALDTGGVIPLAFVPEIYALGPNVRDWMAPRWGGWRLEDVWLDLTPKAEQSAGGNNRP
ncbi:MAG: ABC transporter substrate-binding protein [Candidatus Acidiferrales bacterium]